MFGKAAGAYDAPPRAPPFPCPPERGGGGAKGIHGVQAQNWGAPVNKGEVKRKPLQPLSPNFGKHSLMHRDKLH